jgi:hypothetical protein
MLHPPLAPLQRGEAVCQCAPTSFKSLQCLVFTRKCLYHTDLLQPADALSEVKSRLSSLSAVSIVKKAGRIRLSGVPSVAEGESVLFSDQFRRNESVRGKFSGVRSSTLISNLSNAAWKVFQSVNQALPEGEAIRPQWAPGPLLKSYEKTAPPLGFPRETDSLCPTCVKEVREAVISGQTPLETLMHEHPGEIKAQIVEEDGRIVMKKTCAKHGEFVDVMATSPEFLQRIESLFYGRDFRAAEDAHVHRHGTSDIKFGRGAVLTVDLTNRCNMMCNPCFMDANQVGYVHEPTYETRKRSLIAPSLSNRSDRSSFSSPAASRRFRPTISKPSLTPKRSVSIASSPPRTASASPKTSNFVSRRKRPGSTASICNSTAFRKRRTRIAASAISST